MRIKFIYFLIILFFINNLFGILDDYPNNDAPEYDRYVNILSDGTDPFAFSAGDLVGWQGTNVQYGICHFPYGIQTSGGGTGYVDFATPLPVHKVLELSTACVLQLRSDLILGGRVDVTSSGRIKGGTNRIILNGPLYLNGNYVDGWEFSLRFFGNGNTIFFNDGGYMRQRQAGYDLEYRDVILSGINNNSIPNITGNYNLLLYNTIIELDGDYCFNGSGNLEIYDDVFVTGTHSFCIDAGCNIYDNARLTFDEGTTFSMGFNGSIKMAGNRTGSIYLNGCNVLVGDKDFSIDYGRIIFENEVIIDDDSNYGEFVIGANTQIDVLGSARIVLENTTTFSIL